MTRPSPSDSLFFTFILLSSLVLFTICNASNSEVENEHPFTYLEETAKGPQKWGQIKPEWDTCDTGKLQSPIDIIDMNVKTLPDLGRLQKDYKPAPATLKNRGHDISVQWKGDAGKININGVDYNLLQCHWHSPSEHTLNGTRFDLEMHLVHSNSEGQLAVVGILYTLGRPNPFLEKLLEHVKNVDEQGIDLGVINPEDITFGRTKYYRYIGSLTVPPCTEGVTWTIVQKVRTVSREQVKALRDAVLDGYEENARPTQELGGREVYVFNSESQ